MKKEQVKMDTLAYRTQKIRNLSSTAGSDVKKEYVFTNELSKELDVAPAVLSSWVKDVDIPFTYQKQPGNEGGSPSRRYEAKYIELFVDLAILNRMRRIDLIRFILGNVDNYLHCKEGIIPPDIKYIL